MKILPNISSTTANKAKKATTEKRIQFVALVVAFVSVFFFFIKLLFL